MFQVEGFAKDNIVGGLQLLNRHHLDALCRLNAEVYKQLFLERDLPELVLQLNPLVQDFVVMDLDALADVEQLQHIKVQRLVVVPGLPNLACLTATVLE